MEPTGTGARWPALFDVRPAFLLASTAMVIVVAWIRVIASDLMTEAHYNPAWLRLFNDGPIEWLQWLLLPAVAITAAFLSARLRGRPASFYLLLAVGAGLMLFEDAGDARHDLSDYGVTTWGSEVWGIPTGTLTDLVYLSLVASVPLYALARYGRTVWGVPQVRRYLVGGFGLYAVAAVGSAVSGLGLYERVGRFVDVRLFGGRLPVPEGAPRNWAHFMFVDGPVEESVETLAAACLLGAVLSYPLGSLDREAGVAEPVTSGS
jgi:hypothetical protein